MIRADLSYLEKYSGTCDCKRYTSALRAKNFRFNGTEAELLQRKLPAAGIHL